MNSLESKDMPLRTLDQFYQPFYKEKSSEGLKVFPQRHTNTQDTVLTPRGQLPSVSTYLSGLSQAKHLPRRMVNKYEYYPLVKSCRRHQHRSALRDDPIVENAEQKVSANKSRLETLVSSHPSNRSIMVYSHVSREEKLIDRQKQRFRQTRSVRKEEKEKEMRFSFYNTMQKSEHFLRKFKEDTFIQERKTNNYQNMFKRTITSDNILTILQKANEKYKMGL